MDEHERAEDFNCRSRSFETFEQQLEQNIKDMGMDGGRPEDYGRAETRYDKPEPQYNYPAPPGMKDTSMRSFESYERHYSYSESRSQDTHQSLTRDYNEAASNALDKEFNWNRDYGDGRGLER